MSMETNGKKRVTIYYDQPNPMFEKWITDLYNTAVNNGSSQQYMYKKALRSLQKFPLPLSSGKQCLVLENFGPALSQFLDWKLKKHKLLSQNGISDDNTQMPVEKQNSLDKFSQIPSSQPKSCSERSLQSNAENTAAKIRRKSSSMYVPKFRSGPYAFLITLLSHEGRSDFAGYFTKAEMIKEAQPLCDHSLTKPEPGSRYTGWSSMTKAISKGLISRTGNPAKFSLTQEGRELAIKLLRANNSSGTPVTSQQELSDGLAPSQTCSSKVHSPANAAPIMTSQASSKPVAVVAPKRTQIKKAAMRDDSPPPCSQGSSRDTYEPFSMQPRTFDIILLVDTSETTGNSSCNKTKSTLEELLVNFEVRRLKVGDFLWVARDKNSHRELILPYIVERKRMDDLGGSIKDGRFHEQKFRLKQSGIKNLIYLVENYGNNEHLGLPLASVQQAAVNTRVVDDFQVKYTNDHPQSMLYLSALTQTLKTIYQDKTLVSSRKSELEDKDPGPEADVAFLLTFEELNKSSSKVRNFTIREMLIRQLLQAHGLSVEKALAIADLYPTPKSLMNAFERGGEELLTNVPFGTNNRKVGPLISKALHRLYTARALT